ISLTYVSCLLIVFFVFVLYIDFYFFSFFFFFQAEDGIRDGHVTGVQTCALPIYHDNGAGREYSWWLTQKLTDAYHVKGTFTPMFTYERSVAFPMGHRNCVLARRDVRTLPRLTAGQVAAVGGVHPDDTKMLYRYLKE